MSAYVGDVCTCGDVCVCVCVAEAGAMLVVVRLTTLMPTGNVQQPQGRTADRGENKTTLPAILP